MKSIKAHEDSVLTGALSTDKRYIVSDSQDFTAKLWDFKTGNFIEQFTEIDFNVLSIAISPNNRIVAITSGEKIKVYSL